MNSFKIFKRKIKVKVHFGLQENPDNNQLSNRKNIIPKKSTWQPDKKHYTINTFIEETVNNVENLLT